MAVHHEAVDPFLGYLYQLRFGLLLALRSRSPAAVLAFELLDDVLLVDDISTVAEERVTAIHQLAHSLGGQASLGPKSLKVWKTLGNWATLVKSGRVNPEEDIFCLHTTGKATKRSPLYYLRDDEHRDPDRARTELSEAGTNSTNNEVVKAYAKFQQLGVKKQQRMLDRVYLVDGEMDISVVRSELEAELSVACYPEHLASHVRQLEGWLFDTAIRSLLPDSERTISVASVKAESARIRDMFVAQSLPDEFSDSTVPEDETPADDRRVFVRQLRLVGVSARRITSAQQDQYRAFAQRSQWSREGLVAVDELPRFDRALIEEWRRRHTIMCESCDSSDGHGECASGAELYAWVELDSPNLNHLRVRTAFDAPFLVRGSYQVLADRKKVGWHPRFLELLSSSDGE
ncbi:MAG: hypothetical protein DWQ34_21855 [Planctomycetota bacterium]|nr:MAG: hypothetical protein DWQ34_21855 [Planctomycetota bacterium]REK20280.1 MAG: hypothetical protein DWQ41_25750 [Planctomycetota bacterium]REK34709.1 MAG: hypothetical protein DWQ45_12880 [Planctomycetota bacterium]